MMWTWITAFDSSTATTAIQRRNSTTGASTTVKVNVIIRKTLVYMALLAVLALVFFGSVTVLQRLVSALTGQESLLASGAL